MKLPKTEQVKQFLCTEKLDDYGSVQEIINAFCTKSGETITYSQFHQIYKQFLANPGAFKSAFEMTRTIDAAKVEEIVEEVKTVKMSKVKVDPILFVPLKTKKGIDQILSDIGGVLRGTVNMVVGDPGAGKSTITADILAALQKAIKNIKVLYIQGEQSLTDAAYYYHKSPSTGEIENLFLSQYANPVKALENVLQQGWDVVVIDSFNDVLGKIKASTNLSTTAVESLLISMMIRTAEGDNEKKVYTSFFCIQQVTKGGEFVGSNVIKHATTAMMEIRFDSEKKSERYVEFTKNRRCGDQVFKKLYFTLEKKTGEIQYDMERFKEDNDLAAKVAAENARGEESSKGFSKVFITAETAGKKFNKKGKKGGLESDNIIEAEEELAS